MITMLAAAAIALPTGAALEKDFWDCDYASTQALISQGEAAHCSAVFEKIKADKFGGDFSKFMTWWKANKAAQYKLRNK
jgi:hypothetical protein